MGFLRNEAKSVKYAQCTTKSIENLLKSPAFSKRPKLTRKGTKAAAAEEAEEAAAAAFALELGELNRKAAEFEANADDFAIERAREAPPGDPLREGWLASMQLGELQRRMDLAEHNLTKREIAPRERLVPSGSSNKHRAWGRGHFFHPCRRWRKRRRGGRGRRSAAARRRVQRRRRRRRRLG